MAYKARRTRDLQGEVQAGTNVSVSETTKPDGTKVFTLSADSGEIQTLADMVNSAATFQMGIYSIKDGNDYYIYPAEAVEIIQPTNNDFYQEEIETNYGINGDLFVGIRIKKGGLYRVSFVSFFLVETTSIPISNDLHCTISVINGINLDNREEKAKTKVYITEIGTNKYSSCYVFDSFVELAENDVLGYWIETTNSAISDIYCGNDPILTIQKIR